jgi:hypothetical protein
MFISTLGSGGRGGRQWEYPWNWREGGWRGTFFRRTEVEEDEWGGWSKLIVNRMLEQPGIWEHAVKVCLFSNL